MSEWLAMHAGIALKASTGKQNMEAVKTLRLH
jgi:hypothetical protein